MKKFVLALLPLLSPLATACKSKASQEDSEIFLVLGSIPESFKLADGSYPVGQCLPYQLRTIDDNNQPISLSDLTVNISATAGPTTAKKTLTPPPEAEEVPVFADSDCKQITSETILTSVSGTVNLSTVYLMASQPGTMWITADYSNGAMWTRIQFSIVPATTK